MAGRRQISHETAKVWCVLESHPFRFVCVIYNSIKLLDSALSQGFGYCSHTGRPAVVCRVAMPRFCSRSPGTVLPARTVYGSDEVALPVLSCNAHACPGLSFDLEGFVLASWPRSLPPLPRLLNPRRQDDIDGGGGGVKCGCRGTSRLPSAQPLPPPSAFCAVIASLLPAPAATIEP